MGGLVRLEGVQTVYFPPIPLLLQNPKFLVGYDAEVVCDLVAEVFPILRDGFTHEREDCIGELLLSLVVAIVGDVLMQDGPKLLN